ncbi:MAG: hypothetical protein ACK5QX_11350 [bacterium]|jgi:hypothetical protein
MSKIFTGTIQEAVGERLTVTLHEKMHSYVVTDDSRAFLKLNGAQVVVKHGKAGRLLLHTLKEMV